MRSGGPLIRPSPASEGGARRGGPAAGRRGVPLGRAAPALLRGCAATAAAAPVPAHRLQRRRHANGLMCACPGTTPAARGDASRPATVVPSWRAAAALTALLLSAEHSYARPNGQLLLRSCWRLLQRAEEKQDSDLRLPLCLGVALGPAGAKAPARARSGTSGVEPIIECYSAGASRQAHTALPPSPCGLGDQGAPAAAASSGDGQEKTDALSGTAQAAATRCPAPRSWRTIRCRAVLARPPLSFAGRCWPASPQRALSARPVAREIPTFGPRRSSSSITAADDGDDDGPLGAAMQLLCEDAGVARALYFLLLILRACCCICIDACDV
jgi:hypothetical protein